MSVLERRQIEALLLVGRWARSLEISMADAQGRRWRQGRTGAQEAARLPVGRQPGAIDKTKRKRADAQQTDRAARPSMSRAPGPPPHRHPSRARPPRRAQRLTCAPRRPTHPARANCPPFPAARTRRHRTPGSVQLKLTSVTTEITIQIGGSASVVRDVLRHGA